MTCPKSNGWGMNQIKCVFSVTPFILIIMEIMVSGNVDSCSILDRS